MMTMMLVTVLYADDDNHRNSGFDVGIARFSGENDQSNFSTTTRSEPCISE